MSQEKDFSAIFRRLFNELPPYVHQPPWQDIQVPTEIRRPPTDPAAVMADILTAHPPAELVEACVLVIDPTGEVQLNPSLCQADTAIIALRKSKDHDPFDLLADGSSGGAGAR